MATPTPDRVAPSSRPLLETRLSCLGGLLRPVRDATPGEVVRRQLELHLVAGEDPDEVHPHLSGDVGEHLVAPVVQDHPEHRIRERLDDRPFHLDGIILRQNDPLSDPSRNEESAPPYQQGRAEASSSTGQPSTFQAVVPPAGRVSTSWPSSVTRMVCSQWALSRPSTVTAVHPSSRTSTASVPAFTMGSTASTMPGRNDSSVPG